MQNIIRLQSIPLCSWVSVILRSSVQFKTIKRLRKAASAASVYLLDWCGEISILKVAQNTNFVFREYIITAGIFIYWLFTRFLFRFIHFSSFFSLLCRCRRWYIRIINVFNAKWLSHQSNSMNVSECACACACVSLTPVKALKKHKNGISACVCWKIDFGRL